MAIPSTTATIYPGDFRLIPIKVNKTYKITYKQLIEGYKGYKIQEGFFNKKPLLIGDPRANNDFKNPDGTYKQLIWSHINHMYYERPYSPYGSFEAWNDRFTYKYLNINPIVITIPYHDRGEKIKPGSLKINWLPITNDINNLDQGNINIVDDSNGNLINTEIQNFIDTLYSDDRVQTFNSSEYIISLKPHDLIRETNKKFFNIFNNIVAEEKVDLGLIKDYNYNYKSNYFNTNTEPAILKGINLITNSYNITDSLDNNTSNYDFGFNFGSSIVIPHNERMNLLFNSEFTIILDCKPDENNNLQTMISKNGIVKKSQVKNHVIELTDFINESINIFPFDISILKNISDYSIIFRRSDGKHETNITINDDLVNYYKNKTIIVTRYKYNDKYYIKLFIRVGDSIYFEEEKEDVTSTVLNEHAIIFGASNLESKNQYIGNLSNIKILDNVKKDENNVDSLFYNDYLINNYYTKLNTSYIGNIFYRQGKIVLTSLWNQPNFIDIYKDSDEVFMEFQSTHTIYQYEMLTRIKKGDFNLSQNPTSRKFNISDELIDEFTEDGLQPYFTTIGLYNDKNELMAVAKTAYPIQTRDDVDINILIKVNV